MTDIPNLTDAEAAVLRFSDVDLSKARNRVAFAGMVKPWSGGSPTDLGRAALAAHDAQKRAEIADPIYAERDQIVAALSKVFPSWLRRHPEDDKDWDDEWRWIVFIRVPTGQLSWHIHDRELPMFAHLREGAEEWDGHSTPEKYERLAAMPPQECRAEILKPALDLLETVDESVDRQTTSGGVAQFRPVIVAQVTINAIRALLAKAKEKQ